MKVTVFEGTSKEYEVFLELQRQANKDLEEHTMVSKHQANMSELDSFVRRVLNRRGIPHGQKQLLAALYEAGSEGLLRSVLAEKIGRTQQQLSGVLGAFGGRINNTEGAQEVYKTIDGEATGVFIAFDRVDGEWNYTLREAIRPILEEEGLIETLRNEGYL